MEEILGDPSGRFVNRVVEHLDDFRSPAVAACTISLFTATLGQFAAYSAAAYSGSEEILLAPVVTNVLAYAATVYRSRKSV